MIKHKYTDSRGLRITDERMEQDLKSIEKTESEVRGFLGEEIADLPGYMPMFIQSICGPLQFFIAKKNQKPLPYKIEDPAKESEG